MLQTIFGNLNYGDTYSLRDWISAHSLGHRQLRHVAALQGISLQPGLLDVKDIDNNWLGIHGLAHIALVRLYPPAASTAAAMVFSDLKVWESENGFYDWHQMHDAIHSQLNQALGISG